MECSWTARARRASPIVGKYPRPDACQFLSGGLPPDVLYDLATWRLVAGRLQNLPDGVSGDPKVLATIR